LIQSDNQDSDIRGFCQLDRLIDGLVLVGGGERAELHTNQLQRLAVLSWIQRGFPGVVEQAELVDLQ
jgi:energy-converting hydrogenase Eha subunit C